MQKYMHQGQVAAILQQARCHHQQQHLILLQAPSGIHCGSLHTMKPRSGSSRACRTSNPWFDGTRSSYTACRSVPPHGAPAGQFSRTGLQKHGSINMGSVASSAGQARPEHQVAGASDERPMQLGSASMVNAAPSVGQSSPERSHAHASALRSLQHGSNGIGSSGRHSSPGRTTAQVSGSASLQPSTAGMAPAASHSSPRRPNAQVPGLGCLQPGTTNTEQTAIQSNLGRSGAHPSATGRLQHTSSQCSSTAPVSSQLPVNVCSSHRPAQHKAAGPRHSSHTWRRPQGRGHSTSGESQRQRTRTQPAQIASPAAEQPPIRHQPVSRCLPVDEATPGIGSFMWSSDDASAAEKPRSRPRCRPSQPSAEAMRSSRSSSPSSLSLKASKQRLQEAAQVGILHDTSSVACNSINIISLCHTNIFV